VFIVSLFTINPIIAISATAQDEVTLDIHMIHESTRTRLNNPAMVAGIWYFINVTTDALDFQDLILKFYKGTSMPEAGDRDASNYYEWGYYINSQQWADINEYDGYSYINTELCKKEDDTYSFCVGVKDTLPSTVNYYENWTLEIYKDTSKIYSEIVSVEKPNTGIAKTHGDLIQFDVAPFTEMEDPGDDYVRIETRNLPLYITITYGTSYDDIIEYPDFNTVISPYSTFTSTPLIYSESWKPQILTIESGKVSGSVPGSYIISSAAFVLEPTVEINAPDIQINVGHSDYEIEEIEIQGSNITFQYEKEIEMTEDQVEDIEVYISGNAVLTLDIRSNDNISILKILNNQGVEVGTQVGITSTDTSEYKITTQVKALRENTIGYLYYDLKIGGETKTYSTKIIIGPPEETPGGSTASLDITVIAGVFVVILVVIVYIVYTSRKYKRRY
jgi:hypothetical protein